jgi:hypothetical protein
MTDGTNVSMLVDEPSRNHVFSQVGITHVLRYISICDLFTDSSSYLAARMITKLLQTYNIKVCHNISHKAIQNSSSPIINTLPSTSVQKHHNETVGLEAVETHETRMLSDFPDGPLEERSNRNFRCPRLQ